jgi:hypothetical protein
MALNKELNVNTTIINIKLLFHKRVLSRACDVCPNIRTEKNSAQITWTPSKHENIQVLIIWVGIPCSDVVGTSVSEGPSYKQR